MNNLGNKMKHWEKKYYEVDDMITQMDGARYREVFDTLIGMRAVLGWVSGLSEGNPIDRLRKKHEYDFIWGNKK